MRNDTSAYALRPDDPALLAALVTTVTTAIDDQVPSSTLAKDSTHWQYWKQYCRVFRTPEDRPDVATLTPSEAERENFFQAAFVAWVHPRLKPRRNRPLAKPDSARSVHSSVQSAPICARATT